MFRCSVSHPRFRDSGPTENCIFVFPRTRLWIRHQGKKPFVTDTSVVTLYNRGQHYTREPLAPEGDCCEWFAVDPRLLREAVSAFDPAVEDRPEAPFRFSFGKSSPATYLHQRSLFTRLCDGALGGDQALVVEEEVLSLLHEVLVTTYRFWEGEVDRGLVRPEPDPLDVATRARLVLAETCCENHSLAEIARRVGVSPFYLCRSFRAATGSTLHAYRTDLRLREALNRLGDHGRDLTGLALDLGFSSHSHFTATFRRAFDATPSSVRRQVESNAARR